MIISLNTLKVIFHGLPFNILRYVISNLSCTSRDTYVPFNYHAFLKFEACASVVIAI